MNRIKEAVIIAAIVAISATLRFPGLGAFTSIDEPFWLRQSANFYYALGQRDFRNTLYEYHPAVTTMWIIATGMLVYFPEYRAMGQGYLKPGKVDAYFADHGKTMLQLLVTSRFIQVLVILGLLVLVYVLLRRLFGARGAVFGAAFAALAPFLVGQSRLLNHEAMVGLLAVISLLGTLVYLSSEGSLIWLLLSGASMGLAQLTKSSAAPIIPVVAFVIAMQALTHQPGSVRQRLLSCARTFALWFIAGLAAYVLMWPGMWVAPVDMLRDVYGNAMSYAVQGARVSAASSATTTALNWGTVASGLATYANDLLWRMTPLSLMGLLLGTGLTVASMWHKRLSTYARPALYLLIMGISFVLLFGIQGGPKPPHYITTTYICLDLVAGLGIVRAWDLLAPRLPKRVRSPVGYATMGLILALQAASALSAYPYYISYYDPIVEALQPGVQNPTLNGTGYGIGLDQAAKYLSQKPDARNLVALSANGLGSFSYYFVGTTVPMNDFVLADPLLAQVVSGSDYVVADYYNQSRKGIAQDLEGIAPEKTIWINGIDFLRIYRTTDLVAPHR